MKSTLLLTGLSISLVLSPVQITVGELQNSGALYARDSETSTKLGRLGIPPNRESGGGRGTLSEQPVIALVPGSPLSEATPSESYLVQTVSESLTVWIYMPQAYQSASSVELVLLDETGATPLQITETKLSDTNQDQATIIRFPIDYPLEQGNIYRWQFIVTMDPDTPRENHTVGGLIETIAPTTEMARQLESAQSQPMQIDEIYTQHKIWHDALTLSGEYLMQDPNNEELQATWSNLLASVGLVELANVPIIDCCHLGVN